MVFVTMTSWNTPELRRSTAGGENTACVAQAYTSRAPSLCSTLAAFVMVPAARPVLGQRQLACSGEHPLCGPAPGTTAEEGSLWILTGT